MSLDERRRIGLQALEIGEVEFDVPMACFTVLGIGGPADVLVRIEAEGSLERLKRWCRRERLPMTPLPSQPGLLVKDAGIRGVVVDLGGEAEPEAASAVETLQPELSATGDEAPWENAARLFADPEGRRAEDLVRDAGLSGVRLRGARVSEDRPNFVINEGGATARDVLALIDYLKRKVERQTGVKLTESIQVIGRDRG
ncbi:MAG: hypothetical protein VX498_15155 [Myxococcota bacterium]|nr:hypothetical protein [Myxococcota bacterium]